MIDLHSAFFSIPVHKASQYFFAFLWEGQQYTWTIMSQGLTKSFSLLTLKVDLENIKFLEDPILLQYVNDSLLCSPYRKVSFQEDSIYLWKLLAAKEHKISKEKLQFVQTQVCCLGRLISEQGLHLDPDRLHGIRNLQKLKT